MEHLEDTTDSYDYFKVMEKKAEIDAIMGRLDVQFLYQAHQKVCKELDGPDCICGCHKTPETGNKPLRVELTEEENNRIDILLMKQWNEWNTQQNVNNQYT